MYQTDEDLVELLLIPKVGRTRARTLFDAGFKTIEDLARAKLQDLARVPGISEGIAAGIIESASSMVSTKSKGDKPEPAPRIDICPMCGSMVSAGSKVCNVCGVTFSDEVEDLTHDPDLKGKLEGDDGFWYKDQGKLFICPECGSLVSDGSLACPNCGVRFEEGEEEAPEPKAPAPGDADGFWYKGGSKLSMCPNCGSFLSNDARSCSSCGLVFETDEEEYLEPESPVCPMCKKELPHGADKCSNCGFDFSAEKEKDGYWYKDQGGLFMCPFCGAFIPRDADRCSICGSALEADVEEEMPRPQAVLCPMCGVPVPAGSTKCAECGFDIPADKEKDEPWFKDSVALFICPMCGAFMSEAADKCANCGAVFAEEEGQKAEPDIVSDVSRQVAVEKKADDLLEQVEIEDELDSAAKAAFPGGEKPSAPEDLSVSEPESLVLCPVCGAFSKSGETKCPACGAVFDDIEVMELGAAGAVPPGGVNNAELAKEMAAEIQEIEAELLGPKKAPKPEKKGVSKDFLDRWKRLDGDGVPARPPERTETEIEKELGLDEIPAPVDISAQLDEAELEAGIDELAGASKPGGFWIKKARELASEGRVEEAVACLDRAAETDPDRELEYKRLMLELMGVGLADDKVDLSEIATIDDIGELKIDSELLSGKVEARLKEIDHGLETDPENGSLWQEKGELLEKMGRHAEAVQCFDTSISMTYADLRKESKDAHRPIPQIGIGLTNGQGRVNGRVNGLLVQRGLSRGKALSRGETNGLTNGRGRVNGMRAARGKINGMVNGLAGKVNGLTNGRINGTGMINGRTNGRVNGSGMINGAGMINGSRTGLINGGLVNGLGLVNGEAMIDGSGALRRLRQRRRERIMWRYRLTAMALFVTLVLMLSMLGNIMVENESGAISIDGDFTDWQDVQSYSNFLGGALATSNLRILETGMMLEADSLKARVLFEGLPFNTAPGSVDSVWLFVDIDENPNTGYIMEGRGMDLMSEIYGWNGTVMGTNLNRFDNTLNRTDWNGFYSIGSVPCAIGGTSLEASVRIPRDMVQLVREPSMLTMSMDTEGNSDATDYFMSDAGGGNVATFRHSTADVIAPGTDAVLGELTLSAHSPGDSEFLGLNFTAMGSHATDLADIALTDQNGIEVPTQMSVSGSAFALSFMQPLVLGQGNTAVLSVEAFISDSATGTVGIMLDDANATIPARVRNLNTRLHNIGLPDSVSVDGAFGDWANTIPNQDRFGDVISGRVNQSYMNSDIDLADARLTWDDDSELMFYASVNGIMMGGSDLPVIRFRPESVQPAPESDSDRDSVPDSLDPYYLDFNNDGTPDSQSITSGNMPDLDADGQADYPNGQDWWLNTTVPAGVAAPYGGSSVSVFIGPIEHEKNLGDDRAYIMFDTDANPGTGGNLRGAPGVEYAVVVSGKQNRIMASELYVNDPLYLPTGWRFLRNVSAAADWTRLEGSVPYSALSLNPGDNLTAYVSFEDWTGSADISDNVLSPSDSGFPATGTRSPAGDNVVINEIVPQPNNGEWIELCNPTAASINIGGWRLRIGFTNLVVFPANTILGSFGSGTEYYVATFFGGGNELPNGGATVNLQWDSPGPGWTTVDSFTYAAVLAGQSYARFKNATWGMPTDTNSAADYYTSTAPSRGAPNDRTRPIIAIAKTGDRATALPGDFLTYTIWFNNTGDGNARHVWVNDTLPTGVTYASSSVPFSSSSGQTYRWYFSQMTPGTHSFTITVTVDSGVPTGTVLTNNVRLQYTDQLSRFMGTSSDSWDVTVQIPPPSMQVAKVAAYSNPSPGDYVDFTIYYNNTGLGTASHLWLNDTLPMGMAYVSATPTPASVSGQNVRWYFQNVAPGNYQITLTAQVGTGVPVGTVLTNNAVCDYKDLGGVSLPAVSDSESVTVTAPLTRIVINEISIRPNNNEWVEVCNPSGTAVNIGGWRIRVGGNTAYTFPAGTILGAWGSGLEYFAANTGGNDFPNGGGTVLLQRDPPGPVGWTTIDQTTYPGGIAATQTWSRFKHEDTGMPIDTGSAADFYVSNNAWLVPEGPTPAAPNDRKRPIMIVEKTASTIVAEPGQLITYTIWYNNTGDGNAKSVWVNDTLPSGVDYVSAVPVPTSIAGQSLVWSFNTVVHDTVNSIAISVRMNALPADGEVLTNTAALVYHDALKRPMGSSSDSANISCSKALIDVAKVSDVAEAVAGGTIVYTIYYNNTGSANAGSVWINDTLPGGVTFVSASISPTISGSTLRWLLTSVAPGAHSLTVTVTVNATADSGTITNWAFLDYASNYGAGLGSNSDSAVVIIPEMRQIAVPIAGILFISMIYIKQGRRKNG